MCIDGSNHNICLYNELITRPEESYRPWCDVVCDQKPRARRGPGPLVGGVCCAKRKRKFIKQHLQIPSLHTVHNIQNINEREILRIDSSRTWEIFVYRVSLRFRPLDSSTGATYWLSQHSPDLTVLPYTHGQRTRVIRFRHANEQYKEQEFRNDVCSLCKRPAQIFMILIVAFILMGQLLVKRLV